MKKNDPVEHYTGVGVALGLSFGAAFDDVGTSVALGMALDLSLSVVRLSGLLGRIIVLLPTSNTC